MTRRALRDRRLGPDRRGFNYTKHIPERRSGNGRRILWANRRSGPKDRRGPFYPHDPERRKIGEGYFICSKCGQEITVNQIWDMKKDKIDPARMIIICKDCCSEDRGRYGRAGQHAPPFVPPDVPRCNTVEFHPLLPFQLYLRLSAMPRLSALPVDRNATNTVRTIPKMKAVTIASGCQAPLKRPCTR